MSRLRQEYNLFWADTVTTLWLVKCSVVKMAVLSQCLLVQSQRWLPEPCRTSTDHLLSQKCAKPLPFPHHTKQGAWLITHCEHHHYYIYHSHQNKCNQSSPRSSGSSAVVQLTNKLIIPVPCESFCPLNCFTTIPLRYSATPGPICH